MPKKITTTEKKKAVKKTTKKAASLTSKKTTKKTASKKPLIYADNERAFWVNNGQILNSLLALQGALAEMEKAIFFHHVNSEKNDFADWVEIVLADEICAADLRKTKTPTAACTVVTRHLKSYEV